jgi:predicted PurR-regulated permease PerM
MPLAYAALISLLLYPLVRFFEHNGFNRVLAILFTFLLATMILIGIIALLSTEIYRFINNLPDIAGKFDDLLDKLEWYLYKNFNVQIGPRASLVQNSLTKFMDSGVVFLQGTISTFLSVFNFIGLVPVYVFLLLLYRTSFKAFFMFVTPIEQHRNVTRILYQIQKVVQNYIIGLLTVMAIVAVLNVTVLLSLGIDYAVFFGVLAASLMIIPYLGMIIGSLLPALYAILTKDSGWYPLGVVAFMGCIQFLEGNFITPKVTGNRVKVNALASIVGLVVGGYIWGGGGLIISMPLVAILKVILDNISSTRHLGALLGTEIYSNKDSRFFINKRGAAAQTGRKGRK